MSKKKNDPAGRWAKNFDCCLHCKRTDRKHYRGGYCSTCYYEHLPVKASRGPDDPPMAYELLGLKEPRNYRDMLSVETYKRLNEWSQKK